MEQLVDLVLHAGELLLTSGAEIYRVEETIERMGRAAGFVQVEGFATPTGLFISLHAPGGQVYTRVRRTRHSRNNLAAIAAINSLSREFSEGKVTAHEVKQQLAALTESGSPHSLMRQIVGGGGAMAFTLIFGGGWLEAIFAGLIGAAVLTVVALLQRYPVPKVLQAAVGGMAASAMALGLAEVLPIHPDLTTLGAVMVMTPGVAMTTAIRDLLSGELLSGLSRAAEALVVSVAIATGVAIVISLGGR